MQVDMEQPFHWLWVIVSQISLKNAVERREERKKENRCAKRRVGELPFKINLFVTS